MYIAEALLSFEKCIAQYTEALLAFEICITHSGRNTDHLWNMHCSLHRNTIRLWNMHFLLRRNTIHHWNMHYSLSKSTTLLCNMHYSLRRNTTNLKICIVHYTRTYLPLTQELLTTVKNNSPLKHALLTTHSALNQKMINQSICTYMSYCINIT